MTEKEALRQLIERNTNGMITSGQVTDAGLHRGTLTALMAEGYLCRCGRGIYRKADVWEDDLFVLQKKYERGVYSHETALYLLGYAECAPVRYTLTVPRGYHTQSLEREPVTVKQVVEENYSLGLTACLSPCGNTLCIYNIERTLCDLLRGRKGNRSLINAAMKQYLASSEKDIPELLRYAKQLHVTSKVMQYLEVLL